MRLFQARVLNNCQTTAGSRVGNNEQWQVVLSGVLCSVVWCCVLRYGLLLGLQSCLLLAGLQGNSSALYIPIVSLSSSLTLSLCSNNIAMVTPKLAMPGGARLLGTSVQGRVMKVSWNVSEGALVLFTQRGAGGAVAVTTLVVMRSPAPPC
jgi:hypothetical protein